MDVIITFLKVVTDNKKTNWRIIFSKKNFESLCGLGRRLMNTGRRQTSQTVIAHLYTKFTVQSYVVREILHVSSFLINAQWAKNTIVFGKK